MNNMMEYFSLFDKLNKNIDVSNDNLLIFFGCGGSPSSPTCNCVNRQTHSPCSPTGAHHPSCGPCSPHSPCSPCSPCSPYAGPRDTEDILNMVVHQRDTAADVSDYNVTRHDAEFWGNGEINSTPAPATRLPTAQELITKSLSGQNPLLTNRPVNYEGIGRITGDIRSRPGQSFGVDNILRQTSPTLMSDPARRILLLDQNAEEHQNVHGFPSVEHHRTNLTSRYDYRIDVGNPEFPMMVRLEDRLRDARASFGLPVHGSQQIARAMKYYMYNRFKVPDKNMVHVKSVTHVFFTRPDLNILNFNGNANTQAVNHTESAVLWRRNPTLFKLLTDHRRCRDRDNFNLLLSNQCRSFHIQDEGLSSNDVGKSWHGYEMTYGNMYTGRTAGEFSCIFDEVNDYSVIQLIKLWITYIDNIARGVWSPSYNLRGTGISTDFNSSHAYTRTLDYGASAYVFKCGPEGEDVLYWTKYYGVFPVNTGVEALSWEQGQPIGETPRLNIRFKYSYKRDLSPISLVEFNHISNVDETGTIPFEQSFNENFNHSSRPFVGSPFIEMNLGAPANLSSGIINDQASIKLKFRPASRDVTLNDNQMYRSTLANRG